MTRSPAVKLALVAASIGAFIWWQLDGVYGIVYSIGIYAYVYGLLFLFLFAPFLLPALVLGVVVILIIIWLRRDAA